MFGKLYIVATPIGNLEDVTLRAIRILSEVDIILAEDTRVTKNLLNHIKNRHPQHTSHKPQLKSYHQHSSENKKLEVLKLLVEGKNIALVTDAGTPGVSDPGGELIGYVIEREPKIQIVPIPGASALTTALSAAGIKSSRFIFAGFLPKKGQSKLFTQVKNSKLSLIFFESPHRILKTIDNMIEFFGEDRKVFIARELTKLHETHYRGKLTQVKQKLENDLVKGEIVVILEGE